jgi:ribosomal protein L16 Arg81 hydroxylase
MPSNAKDVPVVEAAGHELEALLGPITPETFVREYWAKKALFVKGFRDKYKGLFDGQTFIQALSMPGPTPENFLHASFDKKSGSRTSKSDWASVSFAANVEQAVPLFKAGATLCVTQMETRVPSLVPFLAAIKRQLAYPGKVCFNAYLSPPETGFNWHFDGRIASTLQIEGTKRWRFSHRPAVAWPRANGALRPDGTGQYVDAAGSAEGSERLRFDEKDTTEVLLEPGDLLILPAGVWHDARGGNAGSLALNLSFTAVSYTVLVRQLLEGLFAQDPAWRSPAPLLPLPGGAPGEMDPEGLAAVTTQLEAAADALRSLRGDSAAMVRLWASFVQNPNPGSPVPAAPAVATGPVVQDERLRVRADGDVFAMLAEGGTRLCVSVGSSRRVEVTGDAIRFVQRILVEQEFRAGDCLEWGDDGQRESWNDIANILTQLKRDGLIETAGARKTQV